MAERITSLSGGPSASQAASSAPGGRPCDSVCIQTNQIYDSCREKDCLEDLSVIFTRPEQEIINRAINVKCRNTQILWVYADVEEVPFNNGFYTVDIKYFFKVTLDVFTGLCSPVQVDGLATFDKKVILFGSEGNARIFSSTYRPGAVDTQLAEKSNMPKAVVEVVDPICLSARLVDSCGCPCDIGSVPEFVCGCFNDEFVSPAGNKNVLVSLGIFTICKLERDVQLLIPSYDFCIPQKECVSATDNNPCELFEKIQFPFDEFYPPQREDFERDTDYRNSRICK